MGLTTQNQTARRAPSGSVATWLVRFRLLALAGFVGLSVLIAAIAQVPERPYVILWLGLVLLIACWHSPRPVARVIVDWLPLLVIAAGYDLVRSFADDLVPRAIVDPQLRFDEIVFGGTAPTVLLQDWLKPRNGLHPWDYLVFCFYLSHFVVSPTFAVVQYVRDRELFRRFKWTMLTVCIAGFVTYFALPAEPPWRASEQGELEPTVRVVQLVWAKLGIGGAADAFAGKNTDVANPVAALPSLHAAWPFLILLFTWRRFPRARWIVVAYNAAMVFVLVYGSEHYVSDILLGYLYAAIGFVVVNRFIDRRDQARATTSDSSRS
jgi:PAP2 superfamily protein